MFCTKSTLLRLFFTAAASFLFTMGYSQTRNQVPPPLGFDNLEICGEYNPTFFPLGKYTKLVRSYSLPTGGQPLITTASTDKPLQFCMCSVSTITIHYTGGTGNFNAIVLNGTDITSSCTINSVAETITYSSSTITDLNLEFHFTNSIIGSNFQVTQIDGGGLCVIMDLSGIDPKPVVHTATVATYQARMTSAGSQNPIENGLGIGLDFSAPLTKWLSLKTDFNWLESPFNFSLEEDTPEQIELLSNAADVDLTWKNYSLLFGPEVHLGKGKWETSLALQGGLMVSKAPEVEYGLNTGTGVVNQENRILSIGGNQGSFAWASSLNLHYKLSKHWGIVGEVGYLASLDSLIQIDTRSYSDAIQGGHLDPDLLSTLPIVTQQTGFKSINFGFGIRYRFNTCKCP